MNIARPLDESPRCCYALQCFAHGTCVLYVDLYADGTLAALHERPGDNQPTHSQRWAPELTRTSRRLGLLHRFLRYVHPELAEDPQELPVYAVAEVTPGGAAGAGPGRPRHPAQPRGGGPGYQPRHRQRTTVR